MPTRRQRTTAAKIRDNPARRPFLDARTAVLEGDARTFPEIEQSFLDAMWQFDQLVKGDETKPGDLRNGKGDFFNDLLQIIIERCSQTKLQSRPDVPGLLLDHRLDMAYPDRPNPVRLIIETKAAGLPRYPGNEQSQPHPGGRPGSADLDKRIKESAFKDIDIKGNAAAAAGRGAGATLTASDLSDARGDKPITLESWLRETDPKSYLLLAIRIVDDHDLERTAGLASAAAQWFEDCGLYCYREAAGRYEAAPLPRGSRPRRLHTVIDKICRELTNL